MQLEVCLCLDHTGCVLSHCAFFVLSYISSFERCIHMLRSIAPVLSIQV